MRSIITLYRGQCGEINFDRNPHHIKLTPSYYVSFPNPPRYAFSVAKTHKSFKEYIRIGLDLKTVSARRDCRDAILSYYFWPQPRLWGRTENEIVFDNAEFMAFLGDWKNYFAQEHIDYINAKAGRLMQRLGYV